MILRAGGGVQYKLAVTRRHKHDSSDFPEDFVSHHIHQKRPHELLIAGGNGVIYKRKQCLSVPSVFGNHG